jgi:hypothetical protein
VLQVLQVRLVRRSSSRAICGGECAPLVVEPPSLLRCCGQFARGTGAIGSGTRCGQLARGTRSIGASTRIISGGEFLRQSPMKHAAAAVCAERVRGRGVLQVLQVLRS